MGQTLVSFLGVHRFSSVSPPFVLLDGVMDVRRRKTSKGLDESLRQCLTTPRLKFYSEPLNVSGCNVLLSPTTVLSRILMLVSTIFSCRILLNVLNEKSQELRVYGPLPSIIVVHLPPPQTSNVRLQSFLRFRENSLNG